MRYRYQNYDSGDTWKLHWSDRRLDHLDILLCLIAALTLLGGHWLTGSCLFLGVMLLSACHRLEPPQAHWQWKRFALGAAALVLFAAGLFGMYRHEEALGPKISWQRLSLSQKLPEPPGIRGQVRKDRWDELSLELHQITAGMARQYQKDCAAFGYEPGETDDRHWTGTGPDGSRLTLTHDREAETLVLTLELPRSPQSSDPFGTILPTAPVDLDAILSWMEDGN